MNIRCRDHWPVVVANHCFKACGGCRRIHVGQMRIPGQEPNGTPTDPLVFLHDATQSDTATEERNFHHYYRLCTPIFVLRTNHRTPTNSLLRSACDCAAIVTNSITIIYLDFIYRYVFRSFISKYYSFHRKLTTQFLFNNHFLIYPV